MAFASHILIWSAAWPSIVAAMGAVGIEEMLVDSDVALGKAREVSCDSWLESESREREYTEAVRDDLKELEYDFRSGEAGV